jgi:putative transposase
MPSHLKRYYGDSHLRFLDCARDFGSGRSRPLIASTCYHRQAWLAIPRRRDLFLKVFEQARQRYEFVVVGYVVMPEHVHLLISEAEKGDPSRVVQAIKQGLARHVLRPWRRRRQRAQQSLFVAGPEHVWQKRFYDFNVWSRHKRVEKLRYMHENPVRRGLVLEPEQWEWSSYRSYACGEAGAVKIKQWGAAVMRMRNDAA